MASGEPAPLDNTQLRAAVVRLVAETYLRPESAGGTVHAGPLQMNYFSIGLPVEAVHEGHARSAFVKIPKEDLRRRAHDVTPFSAGDRRLADEEYRSLVFLAGHWRADDLGVSFVRPLGFHAEYNAIVMERVEARDGCERLRYWDLARRCAHGASRRRLRQVMARLGQSLRRFHDGFVEPRPVDGASLAAKFRRYATALGERTGARRALDAVRTAAARIEGTCPVGRETCTLKGIDIRNVFIGEGDRIVLLDPGKMKRAVAEADLARLLVTYRILWWGSPLFLMGLRPDPGGESAFLEAYYGADGTGGFVLRAQIIKELLKHWHTAHDSLSLKPWAAALKRAVASMVIDPFYARQLRRELDALDRA